MIRFSVIEVNLSNLSLLQLLYNKTLAMTEFSYTSDILSMYLRQLLSQLLIRFFCLGQITSLLSCSLLKRAISNFITSSSFFKHLGQISAARLFEIDSHLENPNSFIISLSKYLSTRKSVYIKNLYLFLFRFYL